MSMDTERHKIPALPLKHDVRKSLESGIAALLSDISPASTEHAECRRLLEQKQLLSSQMEELRATMRNVQEDSERSSDEARQCEAEAALDLSQLAALKDQLQTLREQIQRSKQQQVEHRRAERELRVEMDRAKATFQEVISVEMDVQIAIRSEIGQLQQVVQDLETRIETKMLEIDRLEQANTWARSEVFASGTRWRQQLLWRQQQIRMGRKGAVTTEHTSQEAETLRLMGFCLGALEDDCEEPTTSGKVSGKRLRNDHG
ncbi:unnamed protein product [Durusdinium trenchii]|uniref:Uncharacterized protein n=2 Tax=Durusdinium trenchii TaxID=1381693 RepID=A0ABP0JTH7_9DINO